MKKMAVLGGVVIVLIVVIKIGSIFISPSTKDPTEGQTSTEETFQTVPITPGMTTAAREPVTIEIDNDNGSGNGSGETDALETLPVETSESLTGLRPGVRINHGGRHEGGHNHQGGVHNQGGSQLYRKRYREQDHVRHQERPRP